MLSSSRAAFPASQWVALEGCAESAGHALACAFSSSDEYEAALIAERRAQGRYGPRRRGLHLLKSALAMVLVFGFVLLVVG